MQRELPEEERHAVSAKPFAGPDTIFFYRRSFYTEFEVPAQPKRWLDCLVATPFKYWEK